MFNFWAAKKSGQFSHAYTIPSSSFQQERNCSTKNSKTKKEMSTSVGLTTTIISKTKQFDCPFLTMIKLIRFFIKLLKFSNIKFSKAWLMNIVLMQFESLFLMEFATWPFIKLLIGFIIQLPSKLVNKPGNWLFQNKVSRFIICKLKLQIGCNQNLQNSKHYLKMCHFLANSITHKNHFSQHI